MHLVKARALYSIHEAACSALTHETCIDTWSGMLRFDDDEDEDDDGEDDDDDDDDDNKFYSVVHKFLKV